MRSCHDNNKYNYEKEEMQKSIDTILRRRDVPNKNGQKNDSKWKIKSERNRIRWARKMDRCNSKETGGKRDRETDR